MINGDDSYYDYYNVNGYVHIELEKSFLEEGPQEFDIRWGEEPIIKDYWPNNIPLNVTVSSSYTLGLTFGISSKIGFSINNNSIGINGESGRNIGSNLALTYSKHITQLEPRINSQLDKTGKIAQWSYSFLESGRISSDIETNILYELGNEGDLSEGECLANYTYSFGFKYYKIKNEITKRTYKIDVSGKDIIYIY